MASVSTFLTKIRQAAFGKDVRSSLADGLEAVNKETEATTQKQQLLSQTFKQLTINAGNSNAEVVASRGEEDWLPDRLTNLSNAIGNTSAFSDMNWLMSNPSSVNAIIELYQYLEEHAINVRTPPYNVKGDGTDETVILQEAWNNAKNSGRPIYHPPTHENVYGVSALKMDYSDMEIDITSYGFRGIKVFGNAKRNTRIKQVVATTEPIISFIGQIGDRSHAGKITGMILEGVSLEGNEDGGSGIYARSFNDLVIRDCYIQSCAGDAITLDRQIFDPSTGRDEYGYNLKVENVKMLLNGGWGVNSIAQHAIGSALFTNCDIHGNAKGGYNINPSSITLMGGNVIGNGGPGLKVRQTPSFPTSLSFGLNVYGTRFEGNNKAGGHEIVVEGSWSPKFDGIVVLATTGASIFSFGKAGGSENVVRQPTIIGGFFAGDKTTAGQKFLDVGPNTFNLSVINARVGLNEFKDAIETQDVMDLVIDNGTDTYIIYGKNERTTRTLLGKNLRDRALNTKILNDVTQRYLLRYDGTLEWGDGVNNPDTNLYRPSAGQLRTDKEFVVGGAISPGATSAKIYGGIGSPEGSVTASNGSTYLRADGVNGALVYVKTTGTGNMGWVAKW